MDNQEQILADKFYQLLVNSIDKSNEVITSYDPDTTLPSIEVNINLIPDQYEGLCFFVMFFAILFLFLGSIAVLKYLFFK